MFHVQAVFSLTSKALTPLLCSSRSLSRTNFHFAKFAIKITMILRNIMCLNALSFLSSVRIANKYFLLERCNYIANLSARSKLLDVTLVEVCLKERVDTYAALKVTFTNSTKLRKLSYSITRLIQIN